MIELVQGEGGVTALDKTYVQQVAALAQKEDLLLIVDEVQTGNGRTGSLYAYIQYGITPDVVTTAKGLGGGLPIGACMMGDKVKDVLTAGTHGSTYGANPVCCAGALNVLERLDDALFAEIEEKSQYIIRELSSTKGVVSVTGKGFMLGVACEKDSKEIVLKCIERGVLVLTAKNKIRLLPALNIPFDVLKKAIQIIKEVIAE